MLNNIHPIYRHYAIIIEALNLGLTVIGDGMLMSDKPPAYIGELWEDGLITTNNTSINLANPNAPQQLKNLIKN